MSIAAAFQEPVSLLGAQRDTTYKGKPEKENRCKPGRIHTPCSSERGAGPGECIRRPWRMERPYGGKWEFPKKAGGPSTDPRMLGPLLQGDPQEKEPQFLETAIYGNSQ